MKEKNARFLSLLTVAVLLGLPSVSAAASLSGTIEYQGTFEPDGGSLATATGIIFFPNTLLINSLTGDLANLGWNPGDVGIFTSSLTFAPLDTSPFDFLWSLKGELQFFIASLTIVEQTSISLMLSGSGMLRAPGFDDTPATFALTTTSTRGGFSFTSGVTAVIPLPAPLILFVSSVAALLFTSSTSRSCSEDREGHRSPHKRSSVAT